MTACICFALEGILTPADPAAVLGGIIPGGERLLQAITRYDALLTREERADYQPGDLMAQLEPFLVRHHVLEKQIIAAAAQVPLAPGATDLTAWLHSHGWKVFALSNAPEPFAFRLARRLEIYTHNIQAVPSRLETLASALSQEDAGMLERAESKILALPPDAADARLLEVMDSFYFGELPASAVGRALAQGRATGSRHRLNGLARFASDHSKPLYEWVVVGDSVLDSRVLQEVEIPGGLAIAFNASAAALPYATMCLAATSVWSLVDVLRAWQRGGRGAVRELVSAREQVPSDDTKGHAHWLADRKDLDDIITIHRTHQRLRRYFRSRP